MDTAHQGPGGPTGASRWCPTCGSPTTPRIVPVGAYRYARCGACGSGWLDPLPDEDPVDLYDDRYFKGAGHGGYTDYEADAALHRRNASRRLDLVAAALGHPTDVALLDVGAATGYVLAEAARRGWWAAGVEPSPGPRAIAMARGGPVHADLATAVDHAPPLDAVTFFQVLEHTADPEGQLRLARTALRRGGVLVVETWDAASALARALGTRWQQVNPPSVVHLFTAAGLQRLLTRCGYDVDVVTPTGKWVSVGTATGVLANRARALRRPLERLATSPIGRVGVPYRLGDLVTAVARVP